MCKNPFLCSARSTVAGEEVKESALISSQACTGMAFDNPGHRFSKQKGAAYICPCLCMMNRMRFPAPDVVEHGSSFKQVPVNKRVVPCILKRAIRDSPAVRDHFWAATGVSQQILVLFTRTGHDQVIPECSGHVV